MAFTPIALTVPQYSAGNPALPASGWVLKAYKAGTATVLQMATDSTGLTLVNDIVLNAEGEPEVTSNVVIPHINESFKLALYPTQAAADANTGERWNPDNLTATGISASIVDTLATIPLLRAFTGTATSIILQGSVTAGDGKGALYRLVTGSPPATFVDDGAATIVPTGGDGSSAWLLINTTSERIRLIATSDLTLISTTHAFQIGLSTGLNIAADINEIMARNNGAISVLGLNNDGGDVTMRVSANGFNFTNTEIQVVSPSADRDFTVTPKGTGANDFKSGAINENKGADIASATTTDIGAATGNFVDVTGTTTITALGTVKAGVRRIVQFDGILILTHNATSLILPGGANITTAAGDTAVFLSLGGGNWKCTRYTVDLQSLAGSVLRTEIATTSGTSHSFTSIPAWVQKITLMFDACSIASGNIEMEIGDSGGFEITGYVSTEVYIDATPAGASITDAFTIGQTVLSAPNVTGVLTLTLGDTSNTWFLFGALQNNGANETYLITGRKSLSATLDRLQIKSTAGAFDGGTFNIMLE